MGLAAAMGALGVTGARFTPLLMTRNELVITGVAIAAIAVGVALAVACPPLTGLFFVGLSLAGLGIAAATKVALSVRDFHAYIDGFLGEMGPDRIGTAGYGALETASLVLGVPKELLGYIIRKNAPEDISATNDRQGVGFVADALETSVLGLKRALAEVYPYHREFCEIDSRVTALVASRSLAGKINKEGLKAIARDLSLKELFLAAAVQHLLNTTSKPRPGTARFATSEGAYKGVMNALAAGVSPTIDGLTENLTPVEEVEIDLVEAAIRGSIQAMLVEKFELGRVY